MISKYTKEYLEPIVQASFSYTEVQRKLGLSETHAIDRIKPLILSLGIDVTHFKIIYSRRRYTDEELFVEYTPISMGGGGNTTARIKKALLKQVAYECSTCGISTWNDKPITLEMDHINGVKRDNRLSNLRLLCPNCHSQTSTFRAKNNKKNIEKRKETTVNDTEKNNN